MGVGKGAQVELPKRGAWLALPNLSGGWEQQLQLGPRKCSREEGGGTSQDVTTWLAPFPGEAGTASGGQDARLCTVCPTAP